MSLFATRVKLSMMRHLSYHHHRRTLLLALALVAVACLTLTHRVGSIPAAASNFSARVAAVAVAVKRSEDDDQHISHRNHPHHHSVQTPIKLKFPDDTQGAVETEKIKISENEKFLTYLPHSGFNNQRIELENAILLAYYLNRTLIVPPVILGEGIQWSPFDELSDFLAANRTRTLTDIRRCSNATRRFGPPISDTLQDEIDPECAEFASWTTLPWTFFFDFNKLSDDFGLRFIHRNELHPRWFTRAMDIANPETSPQIRYVKDKLRHDYRIYDLAGFNPQKGKYHRKLKLDRLIQVRAPVMYFGSLFGNGRVRVDVPAHKDFFDLLEGSLVLANPILQKAAMNIVTQIGGTTKFVSLHVRLGEGYFAHNINKTLKSILKTLGEVIPATKNPRSDFRVRPTSVHDRLDYCRRSEQAVIYMATDAMHPSLNLQLKSLYQRYAPCIFTYGEFPYMDWLDVENTPELRGAGDGINLRPFLEPIVDGIVAGLGSEVIGTPGSTFSAFIERLNYVWIGGPRRIKDGPLIEV